MRALILIIIGHYFTFKMKNTPIRSNSKSSLILIANTNYSGLKNIKLNKLHDLS